MTDTNSNYQKQLNQQLQLVLCFVKIHLLMKQITALHIRAVFISVYSWQLFQTTSLGMFTKLWKATISFVMSVCPFPRNNPAPTGRIFMQFDIFE